MIKFFGKDNSAEFKRDLPKIAFKSIILKGILGIILFFAVIFIYLITILIFKIPFDEKSFENVEVLAVLSICAYGSLIIYSIFTFYPSLDILKKQLRSEKIIEVIKHSLFVAIFITIFIFVYQLIIFLMNPQGAKDVLIYFNNVQNSSITKLDNSIFLSLILYGMIGIGEELFFRGGIYRILRSKFKILVSLIISAFIFSLIHIPTSLTDFFPTFFIGIVLAWYLEYKNNLTSIIILHFFYNLLGAGIITFLAASISRAILNF